MDRLKLVQAKDIMTREAAGLSPHSTLREVAAFMSKHLIAGVPIVDSENRVIGIISNYDLINQVYRCDRSPHITMLGMLAVSDPAAIQGLRERWHLPASDTRSPKLMSASEEATVEELTRLMVQNRISRVPIVCDGNLVGVVTSDDLLHEMRASGSEEMPAMAQPVMAQPVMAQPAIAQLDATDNDEATANGQKSASDKMTGNYCEQHETCEVVP